MKFSKVVILALCGFFIHSVHSQQCPLTSEPPSELNYEAQACPYQSETCCSSSEDSNLNEEFISQLFESNYGDEDNCCHQRVSDLICGQQCSPDSGEYVDNSGSGFVLTACPSFCSDTYDSCKHNVILDSTGKYLRSIEDIMTHENPENPAAAFCASLSGAPGSQTDVQVGSNEEQCFEQELSSCNEPGFEPACPAIPSQKPSVQDSLEQCSSYNGQPSCCSTEQDSVMASRFGPGGIVDSLFGVRGDCCPDSIAKLFCQFNCGTDNGRAFDVTRPNAEGVANVTVHACESYCNTIYESCKEKTFAGSTIEEMMKSRNSEKPHQAMCEFISTSLDPTYEAGPLFPVVTVTMRDDGDSCFGTDPPTPPECEMNKSRDQDSSLASSLEISVLSFVVLLLLGVMLS